MILIEELDNLDLTSSIGQMIENTQEFITFDKSAEFIQETLRVLDSDNLAEKKIFFIDNQTRVTNALSNLHNLFTLLQDNMIDEQNGDADIAKLVKIVGITIKKLERGIENFNRELVNGVSPKTEKEQLVVDEDSIKEAMKNSLDDKSHYLNNKDIDEATNKIRDSFKDMTQQKKAMMHQQCKNNGKPAKQQIGYLVISQDFSDFRIIPGTNLPKNILNQMIEKSGIDDPRVFQLTELPTKKQTIQKVVTVIG